MTKQNLKLSVLLILINEQERFPNISTHMDNRLVVATAVMLESYKCIYTFVITCKRHLNMEYLFLLTKFCEKLVFDT